jgi:PAP2 superfamily
MSWFKPNPFPPDEWGEVFKNHSDQAGLKYLDSTWPRTIKLNPPDPSELEKECRDVLAAKDERDAHEGEISAQAISSYAAIAPVQKIIGRLIPNVSPYATATLIDAMLQDAVPITFRLKEQFNRGRPHHCCDLPLEPMFWARLHTNYPGHPAYPSGHSTQVHIVAELYARMFPTKREALFAAAYGVARNREIAGLHYASDTVAGRKLAVQLVDAFLKVPRLNMLFEQAKREW